jgi:hypothetical protein
MGDDPGLDGWSDPPSDVRITVLQDAGDRSRWRRLRVGPGIAQVAERLPRGDGPKPAEKSNSSSVFSSRLLRRPCFAAAVIAVMAAVGALLVATLASSSARRTDPRAGERERARVAAAYGYPSGCLRVTIASSNHAFARADFNHANPCGRYAGDPTAIFHLVGGAWRPVLEAVSYRCPATGIPAAVQRELEVCPF